MNFTELIENYLVNLNFGHCNKYLNLDSIGNNKISLSFKDNTFYAYGFAPHRFSMQSKSAHDIAVYLNKIPMLKTLILEFNTLDAASANEILHNNKFIVAAKAQTTKKANELIIANEITELLSHVAFTQDRATISGFGLRSVLSLSNIDQTKFSKTCTMFCKVNSIETKMVDVGKEWDEKEFPIMVLDAVLQYYRNKK